MLRFDIPVRTPNVLNNSHGHWARNSGRRKKQREATAWAWLASGARGIFQLGVPLRTRLRIRLTRLSAGELDDDAVAPAMKSVRDQLADELGLDDRSKLLEWEYAQEKCKRGHYAVRVEVSAI